MLIQSLLLLNICSISTFSVIGGGHLEMFRSAAKGSTHGRENGGPLD